MFQTLISELNQVIRTVPDFPKPGIQFKDIAPIFWSPKLMNQTAEALAKPFEHTGITKVVGIESRGFLFGPMIAERLGAGFVLARKPHKLPGRTVRQNYALEYGTDAIEIQIDAITDTDTVLIHDDVLATGGTAQATHQLVTHMEGKVHGFSFIMELDFLGGRSKLNHPNIFSLLTY